MMKKMHSRGHLLHHEKEPARMKGSANEEDESEHRTCFIVGSLATAACAHTGLPLHLPNSATLRSRPTLRASTRRVAHTLCLDGESDGQPGRQFRPTPGRTSLSAKRRRDRGGSPSVPGCRSCESETRTLPAGPWRQLRQPRRSAPVCPRLPKPRSGRPWPLSSRE